MQMHPNSAQIHSVKSPTNDSASLYRIPEVEDIKEAEFKIDPDSVVNLDGF